MAASHARCSQVYIVIHHMLLLPSIVVPAAVSLFGASEALKYTIVGASAATAQSLALRLELRAYIHGKASQEYLLLSLDERLGNVQRVAQILRDAPMLPCCASIKVGTLATPDQSSSDVSMAGP